MKKLFWLIFALFLPMVAVGLLEGVSTNFWINLLLWFVGCHIGGVVHAWYLIFNGDYELLRD